MKRLSPILSFLVVAALLVGLLLSFVATPQVVYASDGWYNSSFPYRMKVTFDNSGSSSDLDYFPVLIHLDDSNADWTHMQNDGDDIRITDSNGQTLLNAELELWDDTNDAWIWCNVTKIDAGSTSDYIYVYYGNTTVSSYWNPEGVWRSEYEAVWHLSEETGTIHDSTSNHCNSTAVSGITYNATGTVGNCISFDGNDYITIGDLAALEFTGNLTWEAFVYIDNIKADDNNIISKDGSGANEHEWLFQVENGGQFGDLIGTGAAWTHNKRDSGINGAALCNTTWYGLGVTWDGSTVKFWGNGTAADPVPTDAYNGAIGTTAAQVIIGANEPLAHYMNGDIDEIRISDTPWSEDWLEASYLSATDAFASFGSEEEATGVSVSTDAETNVGTTTATLNGELTAIGDFASVHAYFQYGQTTSYGTNSSEQILYGTGTYSQGITGLSPSTTYHFRAAVRYNSTYYTYGSDEMFYTDAEGDWYGSYKYRAEVELTKTTTVTNYPVNFTIHKGTGTSANFTIYLQDQAESWLSTTPNDVRFTNDDQILMDYWIESSSSTQATFWMEADSLSNVASTFYVYWGLAGDTTTSDIEETFTFGDDFEGYSNTTLSSQSDWEDISSVQVDEQAVVEAVGSLSTLEMKANDRRPYVDVAFGSGAGEGRAVGLYAKVNNGGSSQPEALHIQMFDGTEGPTVAIDQDGYTGYMFAANSEDAIYYGDGTAESRTEIDTGSDSTTLNTWHKMEFQWYSTTLKVYVDGEGIAAGTDATYSDLEHMGFACGGNADWNIDWVYVRKYDGETILAIIAEGEGSSDVPTVTTGSVSGLSTTGATLWGSITDIGDAAPTIRGFDYGRVYDEFTVVVMPDTQTYTLQAFPQYQHYFSDQTEWIADNIDEWNIAAVIHNGDIVDNAWYGAGWTVADTAMDELDGLVPYTVCPGNHDYNEEQADLSGRSTASYDTYFGPSRFSGYDWYGGSYPSGTNRNNYILFEASGLKFLVLSFEYAPEDAALAWGRTIMTQYPDRLVIINTHAYMYGVGNVRSDEDLGHGQTPNTNNLLTANDGEEMWDEFVSDYDNIVLVTSGHFTIGADYYGCHGKRTDYVNGEPINQALANYQSNGPEPGVTTYGYLRLYQFKPSENIISVYTYNPYDDTYFTTSDTQFDFPFRGEGGGWETFAYSQTTTGTFGTGSFSEVLTGLTENVQYRYRAKAYNTEGWGYGTTKTFLTTGAGAPGAPVGLSASATASQISISWTRGTGAFNTLLRYATDTYPTTVGSGAQLYYGTGTSTSLTSVVPGLTYYFSAWSEAGGVYSATYATTSASLGTPGELPNPNQFLVENVRVYRNYLETGDLIFVSSLKIIMDSMPAEDVKDCVKVQLYEGAVLKAQSVPTQWGFRPASIYLAPGHGITWGGNYTVEMEGREEQWASTPSSTYSLSSGSWISDLSFMKDWVLDTGERMEDYYDLDLVTYSAEGRVLTETGGEWFSDAIPNLRSVFPELFSAGMAGIEGIEEGEVGYEGAENMTVAWGDYIAGQFESLGESIGLSGENAGGIIWIVFVFFLAGLAGLAAGPAMGFIVCLPLVGTGVYLRLLDMPMVIAIGVALFVLAMFVYFIQGKVSA